jgi:uncharacterized repeat protein (TIGR03803 family)
MKNQPSQSKRACVNNLLFLPALIGVLGLLPAARVTAQTFKVLHAFSFASGTNDPDGAVPKTALVVSGNVLYGTGYYGGSPGNGTVFAVNTDGTAFTVLHTFTGTIGGVSSTNGEGVYPGAGLILSGNTLYGTTGLGGHSGSGTVFALNTDGTGFATLHSFALDDGVFPQAGLVLSGDALYGTTYTGGGMAGGTVFRLSLAPQLIILPSSSNVILTWPTNLAGFSYAGYTLQSTANLGPAAAWTLVSPAPVLVNGQYTVTNPISGNQQFYRLSQ